VRTICEYIKAVAEVSRYGENKEIKEHTYNTIFDLVRDLSAEALRRQELALAAMEENRKRHHDPVFSLPKERGAWGIASEGHRA
jgi:hypothetical protein